MPTPNSHDGLLISDTRQTLIDAPVSGKRVVTFCTVYNADTAAVKLTLWLHNTTLNLYRGIAYVLLGSKQTFDLCDDGNRPVLQSHQRLMASLAGPVATEQPQFFSSWEEWQ